MQNLPLSVLTHSFLHLWEISPVAVQHTVLCYRLGQSPVCLYEVSAGHNHWASLAKRPARAGCTTGGGLATTLSLCWWLHTLWVLSLGLAVFIDWHNQCAGLPPITAQFVNPCVRIGSWLLSAKQGVNKHVTILLPKSSWADANLSSLPSEQRLPSPHLCPCSRPLRLPGSCLRFPRFWTSLLCCRRCWAGEGEPPGKGKEAAEPQGQHHWAPSPSPR